MRLSFTAFARSVALLTLLALASTPVVAAEPKPDDDGNYFLQLEGWVDVSATGELSRYDVEKPEELAAEIRDGVLRKLNAQGVVPVQREGREVALRSWLEVGVRLTPSSGDRYTLVLDRVTLGPRPIKRGPLYGLPMPPLRRAFKCWHGSVIANFTVTPKGRVEGLTFVQDGDVGASYSRGLTQASKRWNFQPETINGVPVASPMRLVFVFNGWGKEPPPVSEDFAWALPAKWAQDAGLAAARSGEGPGLVSGVMADFTSAASWDARTIEKRCGKLP
jgi:hypothetical protein